MKQEADMPRATPRAFASEAELEAAYERFLADLPQAGRAVTDSHDRMEECFRDYLDAFEKWVFRHAYESGYAAAVAADSGAPKRYRVRFWLEDQDGREEHMEFGTMAQAQAFYDSRGGKAEIQEYIEERHRYEAVVYPSFEV